MLFRRLLRERFLWFSLLGTSFFLVEAGLESDDRHIVISGPHIAALAGRWSLQSGREPSPDELEALLSFHLREEVLVREAKRRGLDQGDVIIRRRLAQKMELLLRDDLADAGLSREQVADYYAGNRERYRRPQRVSFRHIYLGEDEASARHEAEDLLAGLAPASAADSDWSQLGRPFIMAREYALRSGQELSELFGTAFADTLTARAASDHWLGPLRSVYGWHLVRVLDVRPAQLPPLAEVEQRVASDARKAMLREKERAAIARLMGRYSIIEDWRTP